MDSELLDGGGLEPMQAKQIIMSKTFGSVLRIKQDKITNKKKPKTQRWLLTVHKAVSFFGGIAIETDRWIRFERRRSMTVDRNGQHD